MKRNKYLNMKPLVAARDEFLGAFDWIGLAGSERLETAAALGRVTAEPVFARLSSPSYQSAAMDGRGKKAEELTTYFKDDGSQKSISCHAALFLPPGWLAELFLP